MENSIKNVQLTHIVWNLHSLWDQEKRSKRNSSEIFGFFKKQLVEYSEIRNKLFAHKKNKKRAMENSLS